MLADHAIVDGRSAVGVLGHQDFWFDFGPETDFMA
jgi:hypothetical protein